MPARVLPGRRAQLLGLEPQASLAQVLLVLERAALALPERPELALLVLAQAHPVPPRA